MAIDERGVNLKVTATNETQQGFEGVKQSAREMANTVTQESGRASQSVGKIGDGGQQASQKVERSTRSMIQSIQRTTAAMEAGSRTSAKYYETLAKQRGVDPEALRPYLNQLEEVRLKQEQATAALGAGTIELNKYGLSAKQTAAALRGVPAQLTDIFVSLQGGQRPMTVLIQQGGQLKDMFGGIVPAARALGSTLLGMINPITVAAAAAGTLFLAYRQGAAEMEAFNSAITISGGIAGVTSGQLAEMATNISRTVGTVGRASDALTKMAGSGKIARSAMEEVASAAIAMEIATGKAVSETIDEFAKLATEPAKAAAELNEKYNFLTTAIYRQIAALEEQGRKEEAVALAQKTLSNELASRAQEVASSVGLMERAWNSVAGAAKSAWDAMLDIGREKTVQDRIKEIRAELDLIGDSPNHSARANALRAQLVGLEDLVKWQNAAADARAREAEEVRKIVEAEKAWAEISKNNLTKREQIEREVKRIREIGIALGKSELEIEKQIAAYRAQHQDKPSGGISTTQTELARLNALLEAERQREESLHSLGLAQANLNEGERLAIQYAEKLKLATDAKTRSQLQANKALAEEYGARKRANDEFDKELKARQSAIDAAKKQTERLRDEIETYGMGKSAIEAMTIARLEERLAVDEALGASAGTIESLKQEIAARKELYDAMRTKEQLDAQLKEWQNWEREVDRIFDQLGQSLTDQLFEGGKSARDMLKDMFKALTLRVVVQPMLAGLQGMVTQQIGGLLGFSDPRQQGGGILNIASNINSLNTLAGGITQWMTGSQVGASNLSLAYANATSFLGGDSIGALIQANGGWEGALSGLSSATSAAITAGALSAAPSVAASLSTSFGTAATTMASTSFTASLGGGAAAAGGGAAAAGAGGLMSGIAAAAPWIGGALAIGSAFGLFGDDKPRTRHAQQGASHMLPDGSWEVSSWDDRQDTASQIAARDFAQAAVKHANELFERIGIDASIHSFQTLMESSILGDKQGVGSSGQVRIGDVIRDIGLTVESSWTKHGFGGWSEAEMLPRLMTDVQLTILEAFQAAGDQLPSVLSGMLEGVDIRSLGAEQAQELAQRFQLVVDQVSVLQGALERLPFEQLRDLSFDAAANLIQFAGGLEQLDAGMTSYFENFYSEEEKLEWAAKQIGDAFGELGLTMPDVTQGAELAKAAYRDLVESLDVTTEEGQRAYATLMTLSGGFAELVTGMDQLADAAARAAEEQRRAAEEQRREAEQLRQQLMGDLSTAYNAVVQAGQREIARLQESFGATDNALNAYRSAVQRLESEFNSLFSAIDRGIQALRGTGAAFDAQYHQARAVISTTLLTGQLPQTADLSEAIRVAQQGVMGQRFASYEDQQRAYLTLANEMEAIKEIAGPELDAAQATLAQLEDQYRLLRGMSLVGEDSLSSLEAQLRTAMSTEEVARRQVSVIEQQLEEARRQYDALTGIDTSIKDLATAMREFAAAAAAARTVVGGGGGGGGNSGPDYINGVHVGVGSDFQRAADYYRANPDVAAAFNSGASGDMSFDAFAKYHYETYGRYEGRKSFAVGTSYVPYDMTANIHKGEIIIDPRSSDILRRYGIGVQGGTDRELIAEIRGLRAQNARLETRLASIEHSTGQMADQIDNISAGGNALAVEVMA